MPSEQSLGGQWLCPTDHGIGRDMDNSFKRAVWCYNIDAEWSGERGSNLLLIQLFTVNRRRLDDVVR